MAVEVALVDSRSGADLLMNLHIARDVLRRVGLLARAAEIFCTRSRSGWTPCSIPHPARRRHFPPAAPRRPQSVVLRSIETTASLVSVWMCAPGLRSAWWRCSALGEPLHLVGHHRKAATASPAMEDWIEAFNARMLVCSAMR